MLWGKVIKAVSDDVTKYLWGESCLMNNVCRCSVLAWRSLGRGLRRCSTSVVSTPGTGRYKYTHIYRIYKIYDIIYIYIYLYLCVCVCVYIYDIYEGRRDDSWPDHTVSRVKSSHNNCAQSGDIHTDIYTLISICIIVISLVLYLS